MYKKQDTELSVLQSRNSGVANSLYSTDETKWSWEALFFYSKCSFCKSIQITTVAHSVDGLTLSVVLIP